MHADLVKTSYLYFWSNGCLKKNFLEINSVPSGLFYRTHTGVEPTHVAIGKATYTRWISTRVFDLLLTFYDVPP